MPKGYKLKPFVCDLCGCALKASDVYDVSAAGNTYCESCFSSGNDRNRRFCEGCGHKLTDSEIDYLSSVNESCCESCLVRRNGSLQHARAKGAAAGLNGLSAFDNPYKPKVESVLRWHWEEMRHKVVMSIKVAGI